MELNLRHDSLNCYGITELLYRSNVIDIRAEDLAAFKAIIAKSFLCIDLLEKPCDNTMYSQTKDRFRPHQHPATGKGLPYMHLTPDSNPPKVLLKPLPQLPL